MPSEGKGKMKKRHLKTDAGFGFVVALVLLSCSAQAAAMPAMLKTYKKAFPDAAAKCTTCHTPPTPGKPSHELNEYGKALDAVSVTAYKKVGTAEDFKKEQPPA